MGAIISDAQHDGPHVGILINPAGVHSRVSDINLQPTVYLPLLGLPPEKFTEHNQLYRRLGRSLSQFCGSIELCYMALTEGGLYDTIPQKKPCMVQECVLVMCLRLLPSCPHDAQVILIEPTGEDIVTWGVNTSPTLVRSFHAMWTLPCLGTT